MQQYSTIHIIGLIKATPIYSDWHMPTQADHLLFCIFPMKLRVGTFGNVQGKVMCGTAVPSLTSKASPPALRWWDWPKVSRIHRSWIERHGRWRWERERMVLPGEI